MDQLSEETLEMEVANDDERMPLVKLPHMMRAIREGERVMIHFAFVYYHNELLNARNFRYVHAAC